MGREKVVSIQGWRRAVGRASQGPVGNSSFRALHFPLTCLEQLETVLAVGVAFWLGEWLVEPGLNRLSRGESTVQLEPRAVDVLVCLARRAGEVVSRQDLIDEVWDTEFVSYNTLASRIGELRQALGDERPATPVHRDHSQARLPADRPGRGG